MKGFACVLLIASVVVAEPAGFRQNFGFQRQELERESTTPSAVDAPYPAAGFRPAKEFNLPSEVSAPPASYGIPDTSYGAPIQTYGPPDNPSTEYGVPETEPTTTEQPLQVEGLKENLEEEPKEEAEVISNQGAYYILLPGSQLQRVQFQTENDVSNMAYTARLQYKNEDRAPLFVYTAVPQYQPSAAYVQLF